MTTHNSLSRLSDTDLLLEVKRLAAAERQATADLIRSLCEVESRGLHLAIGCSSMFSYCRDVLHLSEHASYARFEKAKFARTDRPRQGGTADPSSRYVPAETRRAVSERDGYRCAFVGSEGRCTETGGLQYHHRIPFADGGPTTVDNLELRCWAHNAYEAERWFGPLFVREAAGEWDGLGLDQVARDQGVIVST